MAWAAQGDAILTGADLHGGVRLGRAGRGQARQGTAWAAQGSESLPVRICKAWRGMAWRDAVWFGRASRGMAWRGLVCLGWARHGPHKVVKAYRCGFAWQGVAGQG